jgi:maleate isomerase
LSSIAAERTRAGGTGAAAVNPDAGFCRIGLIALASDHAIEDEVRHFLSPAVARIATTRIPNADRYDASTLAANAGGFEAAAALILPAGRLHVLAYGCTSGTVAIGEAEVRRILQRARPGTEVTTPIGAAKAGLRALGAGRIALLTPYPPGLHGMVADHLRQQGFQLTGEKGLGVDTDAGITAIPEQAVVEASLSLQRTSAEAVFLSCTALLTAGVVETLEAKLSLPVVTSNQALAWHALRLAGSKATLPGRGQLLRTV